QLELREELDAIERKADAESLLDEFDMRLNDTIKQRSALMVQQLNGERWSEAADTVRKLRFSDKLQQQVEQLTEKLL
ncbi:MAG: Fe-S protein assembly co-chaperone HscB, partial [Serratia symbiotica]|nr:Fe-S protein assembly co-chaperone HscB [Serratia symbiotica]